MIRAGAILALPRYSCIIKHIARLGPVIIIFMFVEQFSHLYLLQKVMTVWLLFFLVNRMPGLLL